MFHLGIEGATTAFVKVGVVVACNDNDIAISFVRTPPFFDKWFQPVEGTLDFGAGAEIGQVACVDEEVTWWEAFWCLGVCVGYAYNSNWWAVAIVFGRFVGWTAKVQEEVMEEGEEGGDWVVKKVVDEWRWCKW